MIISIIGIIITLAIILKTLSSMEREFEKAEEKTRIEMVKYRAWLKSIHGK